MNPLVVAAETPTTDIGTFITTITTPIKDSLNMNNLGLIISGGLAIAVVFVLAWSAYRFIYKKVKGGFKKGV